MAEKPLANDASASTKGTVYHLYTTVLKCFQMDKGQTVYVERFGDITTSGGDQVETKLYTDPLTDSHLNFWKTISNWMQPRFDETKYCSLILQTTQDYGSTTALRTWNESGLKDRLAVLNAVHADAEDREAARAANPGKRAGGVPESLTYQRSVLDPGKKEKLDRVVQRLVISANSPSLQPLYEQLKHKHCQGILVAKQEEFVNALIGYVISPAVISANKWEITYDQFAQTLRSLTSRYCRDTRQFPPKFDDAVDGVSLDAAAKCHSKAFVKKLEDIDHHEAVPEAINHYLAASQMVLDELRGYEVLDDAPDRYARQLLSTFKPRYRIALRSVKDVVKDSQNFYDEAIAEPPPQLYIFTDTPTAFRNGVLHMLLDDETHKLKWRLE
jgi:hypothetical protein